MMKRSCLLLLASSMLATPAVARDKSLYVGVEGGLMWAKDVDLDLIFDDDDRINDILSIDHKMGYDLDALFGYDAGMVRAELELGYKRASFDEITVRGDGTDTFDARDFIRTGLVITLAAKVLLVIFALTYWPWMGYMTKAA